MRCHLMKFLKSNKILSDFQHGVRKRRSCEIQLITTIHDLAVRLDRRQLVDAILLDFSKAFDKVPHHCLAAKLHYYASYKNTYPGSNVSLQQQVVFDGKTSSLAAVTPGVPQGTVLGPLLCLVYINVLPSSFLLSTTFC